MQEDTESLDYSLICVYAQGIVQMQTGETGKITVVGVELKSQFGGQD